MNGFFTKRDLDGQPVEGWRINFHHRARRTQRYAMFFLWLYGANILPSSSVLGGEAIGIWIFVIIGFYPRFSCSSAPHLEASGGQAANSKFATPLSQTTYEPSKEKTVLE
jgi:hypothetical protein